MQKTSILLITCLILLTNCQRNEVIKSHGISYIEKREKLLIVNKSNKNDTIKIFGQPATKGMVDNNLWIYLERTKTRGKLLKLGRNYLKKNNVLILEFDKYGILHKKELFDKSKMNEIRQLYREIREREQGKSRLEATENRKRVAEERNLGRIRRYDRDAAEASKQTEREAEDKKSFRNQNREDIQKDKKQYDFKNNVRNRNHQERKKTLKKSN